tara:strand:+ start:1093 stop:1680 length:588 start_codon:yes stop_codon:yes gene_type:complete
MSNIFDRVNYPTQEPDTLVVGDRWVWRRDDLVSDYPLDEYALEYRFTEDSTGNTNAFTIAATEAESTYLVEIASAVTASLTAGDYQWAAFIIRSSDNQRVVIDQGRTEILPNLQNTTADLRSHAKKVLDAIEAVLENRASQDQMSYSIAGRSLSRMSIDDLMTFRNRYRAEYLREIKLARIKNKQDSGNTIKVRF